MKKIRSINVATENLKVTIPRQEAIDIYLTRSKLPSAIKGQVTGFEKLLEGLNSISDDFVTVLKQDKSLVFANQEDEVVGKLIFETRT
jgi:hypothetical protein